MASGVYGVLKPRQFPSALVHNTFADKASETSDQCGGDFDDLINCKPASNFDPP